jgi:histone-lysine N-methyltransferase SETD3
VTQAQFGELRGAAAVADLAPGEPLLISYGALPNDFLLMDYGFIIPGNPNDTAALHFTSGLLDFAREVAGLSGAPFGSPDSAEQAAATGDDPAAAPWQRQLLSELRLFGPGADRELRMGGPTHVDPRLLAALRVLYCQEPAALRALPAGKQAAYLQSPDGQLTLANERAALATAAAVCAVALAQWKGTLAEDEALLSAAQAPPLSHDMRLAVAFRANKKRLLTNAVTAIKAKLQVLAAAKTPQPAGRPMGKPSPAPGGGAGKPRSSSSKARGKR